jgi:uncharacterized protein YoxC
MTDDKKPKMNFFDTKEGTTGMIFGTALVGGGLWLLYKALPYLITLLQNLLYAGCLLAAVAVLAFILIDGTLPKRLWLIYKRLMWGITYSIIEYDPAWVAREQQKRARDRLKTVAEARGRFKGELETVSRTIEGFKRDVEQMQKEANYLQAHNGSRAEIQSRTMRLADAMAAINELQPGYDQMNMFQERLKDVMDALKALNESIDYRIEAAIRKYKASRAMGTMRSALVAAFSGSDDIEGMRDASIEHMNEQWDHEIGKVDSFMEDVEKFMTGRRIADAIKSEDGIKFLEDLNSRTLTLNVPEQQPAAVELTKVSAPGTIDYWTKR